jgi:hypothetical protein
MSSAMEVVDKYTPIWLGLSKLWFRSLLVHFLEIRDLHRADFFRPAPAVGQWRVQGVADQLAVFDQAVAGVLWEVQWRRPQSVTSSVSSFRWGGGGAKQREVMGEQVIPLRAERQRKYFNKIDP